MPNLSECPVKVLIDETNDAFSAYDSVNADYAAFASMAIDEFKAVMAQPSLTAKELRKLLRHGDKQHRKASSAQAASWSSFMAQYVRQNVNQNRVED